MKYRSKRLAPVLKIAEKKELYAAKVLADTRRSLKYYEDKLTQLKTFRDEYANALRNGLLGTTSAAQLREYQHFLKQLNDGIDGLAEQVNKQKQVSRTDQAKWQHAKQHSGAIDRLIMKLHDIEQNIILTREANEVDDRSQRQTKS